MFCSLWIFVFAVQEGKVGERQKLSMRSPAQQPRRLQNHEKRHLAFAKPQINLEVPNFRATTKSYVYSSISRKKNWPLTLPTTPLSPRCLHCPTHCEDCSCLPHCH
uniref:Uncharacterized protein n=1 Tax=Propithecus coquereli TaxID=379532 RepID=A0A2K6GIY0_PROCO